MQRISRSSSYLTLILVVLVFVTLFSLMYAASFLQEINKFKPKISQSDAIAAVQNDLRRLHPDFSELYIVDDVRRDYLPLIEFEQNHQHLQLVFVNENSTVSLINNTSGKISAWYECADNSRLFPYCSFVQPNRPDYRGRLVYGVDIFWVRVGGNAVPDLYMVDATTGKIIDSSNRSGPQKG